MPLDTRTIFTFPFVEQTFVNFHIIVTNEANNNEYSSWVTLYNFKQNAIQREGTWTTATTMKAL